METPATLPTTTHVVCSPSSMPLIHRYFILLKAHYFLFFSAFGAFYPILSITLRSRGLSNTEISYANLIIPFIVFFINPLMGYLADRSRRYLLTFNMIIAATVIMYTFMFQLSPIKSYNIEGRIHYDSNLGNILDFCASREIEKCSSRSSCGCFYESSYRIGNTSRNFTFNTISVNIPSNSTVTSTCGIEYRVKLNNALENITITDTNEFWNPSNYQTQDSYIKCNITCSTPYFCHGTRYPQQAIYVLLYSLLFIIGTSLLSNAIVIGASIGFAALDRADQFGEQRVWGTIGFGTSAFVASQLYDYFKNEFVYIIMFTVIVVMCIIITSMIHIKPKEKVKDNVQSTTVQEMNELSKTDNLTKRTQVDLSRFKIAALIPLMKELDVLVFLSLTFIWGMSYAALDPYLYLYIDEIAPCQSRSIVGWMSLVAASAEVVALFIATRMLKLLGTNLSSISILLAFSVRFSGYYLIRHPFFLITMEIMHYFNFGILYVLIAQKADAIAPDGLSGTLQGVVSGVSFGLGRGAGLIVASLIYTHLPSRVLFLIFAIFNAVAAVIYGLYFLLHKRFTKRPTNVMNIPKIVIESEPNINDEPLLTTSSPNSEYGERKK